MKPFAAARKLASPRSLWAKSTDRAASRPVPPRSASSPVRPSAQNGSRARLRQAEPTPPRSTKASASGGPSEVRSIVGGDLRVARLPSPRLWQGLPENASGKSADHARSARVLCARVAASADAKWCVLVPSPRLWHRALENVSAKGWCSRGRVVGEGLTPRLPRAASRMARKAKVSRVDVFNPARGRRESRRVGGRLASSWRLARGPRARRHCPRTSGRWVPALAGREIPSGRLSRRSRCLPRRRGSSEPGRSGSSHRQRRASTPSRCPSASDRAAAIHGDRFPAALQDQRTRPAAWTGTQAAKGVGVEF